MFSTIIIIDQEVVHFLQEQLYGIQMPNSSPRWEDSLQTVFPFNVIKFVTQAGKSTAPMNYRVATSTIIRIMNDCCIKNRH